MVGRVERDLELGRDLALTGGDLGDQSLEIDGLRLDLDARLFDARVRQGCG
jgi:hypothetical protein